MSAPVPPEVVVETLRRVLLDHHPLVRSETGPLSGCRCGQVKLGQDVIAHVAAQVAAAMPPSPAEEAVKRVEALANEYERRGRINADPTSLDSRVHQMAADRIRAALASPAPAPQEAVVAHNHVSFDIKAVGECSACDLYGRVNWLYPSARHAQCDDTCTVDCGACKGGGSPEPRPSPGSADRRRDDGG